MGPLKHDIHVTPLITARYCSNYTFFIDTLV
jgi:hypothetical protein